MWLPGLPPDDLFGTCQSNKYSAIIDDWCGCTWDWKRRVVTFCGGGHNCTGWSAMPGFKVPIPGDALAADDLKYKMMIPQKFKFTPNPWPARGRALDPSNPPWQTWEYNWAPPNGWPSFPVVSASWANGIVTVTVNRQFVQAGQEGATRVTYLTGMTPSGYNKGVVTVTLGPGPNQFTYPLAADPGSYVSGGNALYSADACWDIFPPPPVTPPSIGRPPVTNPDGTPAAKHTQGWIQYLPPPIDKYWFGGYTAFPSQAGDQYPWLGDPATGTWERQPEIPYGGAWEVAATCAYAAGAGGAGEVVSGCRDVLYAYAPSTKTYRRIMAPASSSEGWTINQSVALDTKRGIYYRLGPNGSAGDASWYTGLNPDGSGGTQLPGAQAGLYTYTSTPVVAGAPTVEVWNTSGFPAAGEIYLNGINKVSYTSKDGNHFYGCSGVQSWQCRTALVTLGQRKPFFRSLTLPGSPTATSTNLLPMTTFPDLGLFQLVKSGFEYDPDLDQLIAYVVGNEIWTCQLSDGQTAWNWVKRTYGGHVVTPLSSVTYIPLSTGQGTFFRYIGHGLVVLISSGYDPIRVARVGPGPGTPPPPPPPPPGGGGGGAGVAAAWPARSTAPGVTTAIAFDGPTWTEEIDPAGPGNLNDVKGLFGASSIRPQRDETMRCEGNASLRMEIRADSAHSPVIAIPFTGPPYTRDVVPRPPGLRIPRVNRPGDFPVQFGAAFPGADGQGGVGKPGGGLGSEWWFQFRYLCNRRTVQGFAGGGFDGAALPVAILSASWANGVATVVLASPAEVPPNARTGVIITGVDRAGYNCPGGVPVLGSRPGASATVVSYPTPWLSSDPGLGGGGKLFIAAPGMKLFILHPSANARRYFQSNSSPGFVLTTGPKWIPSLSATEPRLFLESYIGPGGGNTVPASARIVGGVQYLQWPNEIGGGPTRYQSPIVPPYFALPENEWDTIKVHVKVGHWHRGVGGGGAVGPSIGTLLFSSRSAFGHSASVDPFGIRNGNEIFRATGSWVADGVTTGALFACRAGSGLSPLGLTLTSQFLRVTAVTAASLMVETISPTGAASPATLFGGATLPPRTVPADGSANYVALLPAGVVTLDAASAALTLPIPLRDPDVIPVVPFANVDQNGPMTFVALSDTASGITSYWVLVGLSADRKTLTLRARNGVRPALIAGRVYGVMGIARDWRDSQYELFWARPGQPSKCLFRAAWRGPIGDESPNDALGCNFWQDEPDAMFGNLLLTPYVNGLSPEGPVGDPGRVWYANVIVSTRDIPDPVGV
jgi:hypothetical protein